jgi:Flp pilus assembly protein TadG
MEALVMHRFLSLVGRFGRDERGVFAVLFGLIAVVLVAMGGAAVDYVRLEQARNRAQTALDAAVLALQPQIFATPLNQTDILAKAKALVADRIGANSEDFGAISDVDVIRVDVANGSLFLEGSISLQTIFVGMVGVPELSARFHAEATRRMLNLEVAMVLDNSGSMGSFNRMTYLKRAANCATNILFYDGAVNRATTNCNPNTGATVSTNVRIGIVPFTTMVNVGTNNSNAAWLDWAGASSIAKLNFDTNDDDSDVFSGGVDRRTLFTQTNTSWRGCVEARLAPNDTTDVPPDTANTKFVPFFVPDPASGSAATYISDLGGTCQVKTCEHVQRRSCTYNSWTGTYNCNGAITNSYTRRVGNSTTTPSSSCIAPDGVQLSSSQTMSGNTQVTTTLYSLLSRRELQERMCKYSGTNPGSNATNGTCPTIALLPLNDTPATVRNKINAMAASGGTNIQQGTVWGYHALTPGQPLTEGQVNVLSSVKKVLIVMTDGFNEPNYQSYGSNWNGSDYSAWGYRKDGRLADTDGIIGNENEYNAFSSQAQMTTAMNAKTEAACANAKAEGIEVYTIGLTPPSQESIDSLTRCSSGPGYNFFPTEPSELVDVFITIAGQLAQLRLAQ